MNFVTRSNFYRRGIPVAACLVSLCACSGDEPRPSTPAPKPAAPVAGPPIQDHSVAARCGLPETPRESPQFDLDQADLRPRGQGILENLATCLRNGSMKGESVTIIGHTDPRGTDSYNDALGLQRATAARDYLVEHGVATTALTVESRGERGAIGADRASWQLDRRVEIRENMQSRR